MVSHPDDIRWNPNASVTSHSRAVPGLFTGCFEQKSYVHSRGPHGSRTAPNEFCLPVRGPLSFNACIISLRVPYGFRDFKQPVNSPCGPRTAKYDARAGFLPIRVVSIPLCIRKGAVRHPCGPRTGLAGYEKHWRFPYGARTGTARGTRGVMRIIQPNHKYTAVSSRPGPVAWCDHENSTDVKFLRALHPALRARNRTGHKNRTGPVVGCDWGISHYCRHNVRHGVSNHQHIGCLPNRLFRRTWKKTSTLGVTGLCEGNPPVTGGFPSQRANNAENVSIWWRHDGLRMALLLAVHHPDDWWTMRYDTRMTYNTILLSHLDDLTQGDIRMPYVQCGMSPVWHRMHHNPTAWLGIFTMSSGQQIAFSPSNPDQLSTDCISSR